MAGDSAAQKDLVWVSLEEYSSTVEGTTSPTPQPQEAMDDTSQPDLPSMILLNGIQLKQKGENVPFALFPYCPGPMSEGPGKVDWKIITVDPIVSQHILCHKLNKGDSIPDIIANCNSGYTTALILVNTEDGYLISRDFKWDGMDQPSFPVCILTEDDGDKLMSMVKQQEMGDVLARVESRSVSEAEAKRGKSPSPEELSLTLERAKGKKTFLRIHRPRVDLKKRIKEIITPNPSQPPLCVSENHEMFQKLMDEFLSYENAAKGKSHDAADNSRVFQKLNKFIQLPNVFNNDCMFYVLLAYRVFKYQEFYHCDEHVQFIHKCISKFEEMGSQMRVDAILKFIDNGNFTIVFKEEFPSSEVFQILEIACIVLMKESQKMKSRASLTHHKTIFSKMLWLSVSLKFKSMTGPSDGTKLWYDNMTKNPQSFTLDDQSIADIEFGIKYGKQIGLPVEAEFGVEQLAQIMASNDCIRPFYQLTAVLSKVEQFLHVPEDFVEHIIVKLREPYQNCLGSASKILNKLSQIGTLLAALQDGLSFLDTIVELWSKKKWSHPSYEKEMLNWVYLLLKAVDVTSDKTTSYLKEFQSQSSHPVCASFQRQIREKVVSEVKDNYARLNLVKFTRLFENFFIWPLEVAQEYLQSYKIPARQNIKDEYMVTLFKIIVERFGGAENHGFISEFLVNYREHYIEEKRPLDFIVHLLSIHIPGLFAIDSGKPSLNALGVRKTFQTMLREHIQRNRLTQQLISHVTGVWKSISQMSEFQLLVLSVLQEELISESRHLQDPIKESIRPILEDTIGHVSYDASWLTEMTPHHKFAFGVISVCCSRVAVNETLAWVESYCDIIKRLGNVYKTYCSAKGLLKEECLMISEIPEDIKKLNSPEVTSYFQWVLDIHKVFALWKGKFPSMLLNFDEILEYMKHLAHIIEVSKAVNASPLVMEMDSVEKAYHEYQKLFEALNCHLIRYIPEHPEHEWRLLRTVLIEYGIDIPQKILHYLSHLVIYPNETREAILGDTMLHTLKPGFTGTFHPGHNVSLTLTREVTFLMLKKMVVDLDVFLAPIKDNIDLLTYFFLRRSYIFDTYLRYQLRKHDAIANGETLPTSHLSISRIRSISGSLIGSLRKNTDSFKGISLDLLASALTDTKNLLVKIVEGTAEYTDVTAGGTLDLEKMDIDVEFQVLVDYTKYLKAGPENNDGLHGIQCMLELFQYMTDIQNIFNTCDQYQLDRCLNDPRLMEVKRIADQLEDLESRNQLTPKEAIEKNKMIVSTLNLKKKGLGHDRQCLQIFPAVADSSEFYQLLKEKDFYGEEGQKMFRQKYELITAQLQHEEYNEIVLNHLYAAYKYIMPFLDREQDFEKLMQQVSEMNNETSFKELHTVNKNIHLVRLWFSRAEEDTLEVVPDQLDAILSTGEYKFIFIHTPDGVKAQVFLEYQPPLSAAAVTSPPRMSESQIMEQRTSGVSEDSIQGFMESSTSVCESLRRDMSPPPGIRYIKWTSEQIRDFEQRLGFLDPDKSLRIKISQFLALNQSAYKLLDLYQRLKDLGHPLYIENEAKRKPSTVTMQTELLSAFRYFPCALTKEETHDLVVEAETQLKDWNIIVSDLHTQYETLLFFSIPKLLHLHHKIAGGLADSVSGEISFLFKNNAIVREKLKTSVKALLPSMKTQAEACNAPMEVVGTFIHKLFHEHDMKRYALQPRQPYKQPARLVSAQSPAILHSCHGLSRVQLMSLIINCYNGVPESFQLLRCHSSTTEDELSLFLNRVSIHAFQYMIIGVEKLPYQLQELLLQFQLKATPFSVNNMDAVTCLNFVETGPSVLREMPWITVKEHKDGQSLNSERARKLTRQGVMAFEDFQCITLVYGHAGDGKSHLIRTRLRNRLSHMVLNIPVSEGFTPLSAIKKLQSLPMDTRGCCIYFNFTMLPPSDVGVHNDEKIQYNQLMDAVNWFFFDLLIMGYVEDPTSGESFRLPGGLAWAVFVEVPSRGQQVKPVDALSKFLEDVPTLNLVCTKEFVDPGRPYVVDDDVQLVCKYLKAYEVGGKNGIDKQYRESRSKSKTNPPVKFSVEKDLEPEECLTLLEKFTPKHMKINKTTQKLFVQYMKRRCFFLDNLPAYNFNTGSAEMTVDAKGKKVMNNTKRLGSTLMKAFLKEVTEFCDPSSKADWSKKPHQQLIYDTVDGGSSIGLISLNTEQIPQEELENFRDISISLPSMVDLHTRQWLDDYLSRALNVPLDKNGLLKIIDDSGYVLTLDYTLKMLNIHERHECGMPVIIEGETGVGKTALVEVLSKLWNSAYLNIWRKTRENILEFIVKKMDNLVKISPERSNACLEIVSKLHSGTDYTESDIEFLCELPDTNSPSAQFHSILCSEVMKLKDDPVLSLLVHPNTESDRSFNYLFRAAEYKNNPKATAELVYGILTTKVKNAFYKLNVHAALKPSEILAFFKEISDHANEIQDAYKTCKEASVKMAIPSVTVFLDEINTASCLGMFKEIIVDRTIDGMDVPSNVFILGACNPHRGDSLAATATDSNWISSNYYVRSLHPTLDMLKWDYGSLDEYQERDYINAKLRLVNKDMSNVELASLAELIITSQNLLRAFAFKQLISLGVDEVDALRCSKSCVSQRDIQRVFTFYEWLMKFYNKLVPQGTEEDYHRRAVMVSLAVVYYMRLNTDYRKTFSDSIDKSAHLNKGYKFSDTFESELDWYIRQMDIPKGVAKTQALKENIFSIILCTMTNTPLIIVGPPGCSKTLSFNLVTANLRGQESKMKLFRDTTLFKSLDPHYYQCSRRTTSNEIQTVFSRAINRQNTYNTVPLPISCVVFMDEAGLPEESLESLKVLHYHLDKKDVSFVAISNHMLDAAKTNRAVSLFRSEPSIEELKTLAKGCLCDTPHNPPAELKKDIDTIVKFCPVYHSFMEKAEFRRFFGLRDFIHFVNYLERNRTKGITDHLVLRALERNFNGNKMFDAICKEFLGAMNSSLHRVQRNNILNILKESLTDRPQEALVSNPNLQVKENEVRYKLIIDSSEDNSLLRLLFSFDILKEKETRTYVCSDFPGDSHQQMINTIAAIRHSAAAGHTVIMSQTDELHESFYDLFNQRFRRIDDSKTGPRFYANIAIGAHHKPCRVHPSFQCVVVVKQSEIDKIPHPFLNRFEKYALTHKILLKAVLSYQPLYLRSVLLKAKEKGSEFIKHVGGMESLYGMHDDTLDSLMLSLLPPVGFQEFLETDKPQKDDEIPQNIKGRDVEVFLVRRLLRALRKQAGFRLPHFAREELAADAECVMRLVARDSQFGGQLAELTVKDVLKAIPEALRGLYHTGTKDRRTDLSINACMVISVFLQWLVRHICKRLMQLMTTEALTTRYKTLPHHYTETYLKHQSHFNLQMLIERQLQVMQLDDAFDKSTTGTANRLLLVTRSSALIHQLPARYPAPNGSTHLSSDYDSLVKKSIYYYTEDVCVYKLSDGTTQSNINELFNSFWSNKKQRILLIVANMKETSRELISHLRVMIEENDTGERLKLYVVLLHFPPSMFSSPCYPILFSNTWDHYYLDIIGQNPTGQVIDICEWFSLCCSYLSSRLSKQERVPLNLSSILHESIPIISSRVFFGKNEGASFNCPMEVPDRNKALKKLFDTGVGELLCEKFLNYWEPRVMLEYLEKAAALATTVQTNTLSITDSLQTILRDTFFDFVVHMVSKMNEDMNIDILMDPSCTESTRSLFLALLRVYPMPKLSQIKTLSGFANSISNVEAFQNSIFNPKFPFYRLVSAGIEKIIDQTRKEINQRLDTLHEFPDPSVSLTQMSITSLPKVIEDKSHLVTNMQKEVEYAITQIIESTENNPLKVAIEAMLHDSELFKRYSEAFTHQKLRLTTGTDGVSYKILRLTFLQLHPDQDILTRLALLHICMHVYQLDLSRLVQVLRPLDILLDMAAVVPSVPCTPEQPSPTASFLTAVRESGDLLGQPGDLSKYVLKILFSAIVGSLSGDQETEESATPEEHLSLWYEVYKDVMSMPAVRDYLYQNLSDLSETQHNIMHSVYLVILSLCDQEDIDVFSLSEKVFNLLFNAHFDDKMELKGGSPPRLQEISTLLSKEIYGSSVEVTLQSVNPVMRQIFQGLFEHFFSPHRHSHSADNMLYYLKMINMNSQWNLETSNGQVKSASVHESLLSGSPITRHMSLSSTLEDHDEKGCIPMSVYKHYLSVILDKADTSNVGTPAMTSLILYKPWVREMIGQVLVDAKPKVKKAVPYIPLFYQALSTITCPQSCENQLMQQPLSHLYFTTIFHHLLSNNFNLSGLVRVASAIDTELKNERSRDKQALLYIEQQAVIQAVIQQLAKCLSSPELNGISAIAAIITDINLLLDDRTLGGGNTGGHGIALALNLLKELGSVTNFAKFLSPESMNRDFSCLNHLSSKIDIPTEHHLFPFLFYVSKGNSLKDLYVNVGQAMLRVHSSAGKKLQPLLSLANEWSQGSTNISLPDGQDFEGERSGIFKMMFWLNAYQKFFSEKRSSPHLAEMLRNKEQLLYIIQPPEINKLLQCFLDPSLMLQEHSSAQGDIANYADPIYALFNPDKTDDTPSNAALRDALANLIAVVIASPPTSTHLWYHMFASDQLHLTHIAGFMHDSPIGQEMFYESGVQLTKEGLYKQESSLKHALRGTLSLQSLYLLLWTNAGAFCAGLLTDPDAEAKMQGKVFPENFSIRHFCVKQLKTMWEHLSHTLGISFEERSFLVSRCMWNLLKIGCNNQNNGRFTNVGALNFYESKWHNSVFVPVWSNLKDSYAQYANLSIHQIFKDIQTLEAHYPFFPTEGALVQSLLSQTDIGDYISNTEHILSQFALYRHKLEIGGELLPNLVEFYQWLHQEMAHVITRKDAESIPVSRAVRVLAKSYSPDEGERLQQLYKNLKELYNSYKELTSISLPPLEDNTPLLHVLSCSSNGEDSPDILYTVISEIITTHNNFLVKTENAIRADKNPSLQHYLPQEFSRVHPTEFTDQNCIVQKSTSLHGQSDFVQLICKHSFIPAPVLELTGSSHTSLPGYLPSLINLKTLQEDIFAIQLAGKPLIGPPQSLRTRFDFRDSKHLTKENLSAIEADVLTISDKLLDEFKAPMNDSHSNQLKNHFHSASYNTIMETVSGLRGVAGHLIKKLMGVSQSELLDLQQVSLADFLSTVFNTQEPLKSITGSKKSIFHEIGINSLSINQFNALEAIPLIHLHDALKWFVTWASQGWYEYCALPISMKAPLPVPDREALLLLPETYTQSSAQLLSDLKGLKLVLNHFESNSTITTTALKSPKLSLVEFLSNVGESSKHETLLNHVPSTILIVNYVAFHVTIKQLIIQLQKSESNECLSVQPHKKSWEDFVEDLWEQNLSNFRQGKYTYAVVTTSDQKKRVYTLKNINRSDEDLLNDLMTAGISETELLPDTDNEDSSSTSDCISLSDKSPITTPFEPPPKPIYTGQIEDPEASYATAMSAPKKEIVTKRLAENYSPQQVQDFLASIGLNEYIPAFKDLDISGDILLAAGQGKGLEDLGVKSALHRLKIHLLFRRQLEGLGKVAKRYPVEEVVRFLNANKMNKFVEMFEKHQFDGEMLMEASDEVLDELGISNHIQKLALKTNFKKYITPRFTTL